MRRGCHASGVLLHYSSFLLLCRGLGKKKTSHKASPTATAKVLHGRCLSRHHSSDATAGVYPDTELADVYPDTIVLMPLLVATGVYPDTELEDAPIVRITPAVYIQTQSWQMSIQTP